MKVLWYYDIYLHYYLLRTNVTICTPKYLFKPLSRKKYSSINIPHHNHIITKCAHCFTSSGNREIETEVWFLRSLLLLIPSSHSANKAFIVLSDVHIYLQFVYSIIFFSILDIIFFSNPVFRHSWWLWTVGLGKAGNVDDGKTKYRFATSVMEIAMAVRVYRGQSIEKGEIVIIEIEWKYNRFLCIFICHQCCKYDTENYHSTSQ